MDELDAVSRLLSPISRLWTTERRYGRMDGISKKGVSLEVL